MYSLRNKTIFIVLFDISTRHESPLRSILVLLQSAHTCVCFQAAVHSPSHFQLTFSVHGNSGVLQFAV